MEVGDVVPPDPRATGLVADPVDAELPEILEDDVFALVAAAEVLLGVGGAVTASVDALGPALSAVDERQRTEPSDVVGREEGVAALLEDLGVAAEVGHEAGLLVAAGPALVVAVGPELVLDAGVRVGDGLAPVELHDDVVAARDGLLDGVAERLLDERRRDVDPLDEAFRVGALLRRVHRQKRLFFVVAHQHRRRTRLLRVPHFQRKVAI